MPGFSPPKELTNGIFNEIEEDEQQYTVTYIYNSDSIPSFQ